jgi:probable addiction module antidote protein
MGEKFSKFEVYEFLDNGELIAGYLEEVLKENDPALLLSALSDIAKAKGIGSIAEKSGLGRESMYKALRPGARPRFETIMKILRAMELQLSVQSVPPPTLAEEKRNYNKS